MSVVRRTKATGKPRGPHMRLLKKDGTERKSSSHKRGPLKYSNSSRVKRGEELYSYRRRSSDGKLMFPRRPGRATSRSKSKSRSASASGSRRKLNPWAKFVRLWFKTHPGGTIKQASASYRKSSGYKKRSAAKEAEKAKRANAKAAKAAKATKPKAKAKAKTKKPKGKGKKKAA